MTVLLEYMYTKANVQLEYIDQIFAWLCQHNAATYYTQNYAGIISASLVPLSAKLKLYSTTPLTLDVILLKQIMWLLSRGA